MSALHRRIAVSILFGAASLVVSALSSAPVSNVEAAEKRKSAPPFSLTDSHGAPVTLSAHKGEVVLLDFWATWCTGCKVEIPWFMEFQKKYASNGLRCIGVAMDEEGWGKVKGYLAEHPITYPIVVGTGGLALRFAITSLPVTLLIDRNGRIAESHTGVVDKKAWERRIQQLLKEQTR